MCHPLASILNEMKRLWRNNDNLSITIITPHHNRVSLVLTKNRHLHSPT